MAFRGEDEKSALIDRLAGEIRRRLGDEGAAAERLLRQFYRHVAPADILSTDPADLVGAVASLWDHLQTRRPGAPKIRLLNPDRERDGWTSPHSVIEVANDDMPFLVDSVTAELLRQHLVVHLVIHPVVRVRRDGSGRLAELCEPTADGRGIASESLMHVEVGPSVPPELAPAVIAGLESVLADVRACVEDWPAMRTRVAGLVSELGSAPPAAAAAEIGEVVAFLRWIDDDNFTFTGYREYAFANGQDRMTLSVEPGSGLGILRRPDRAVFEGIADGTVLPPDVVRFIRDDWLVMVSKANGRSTVHRAVHLDTIAVKKYGRGGEVVGVRLFVGLFTSAVFHQSVQDIPLVRRKVAAVLARSGFAPNGHNGKALFHVLETLPRDDMFQYAEGDLFDTAIGILHLQERQRVALFVRRDPFDRFVSCLIFIPRERYTTTMRERMQRIVEDGFGGRVSVFYIQVGEGPLARLQFIVRTRGVAPRQSVEEIEARLIEAGRDWPDDLRRALVARYGEARGALLFAAYRAAFPAGYRERFAAETAVADLVKVESVLHAGVMEVDLYRPEGAGAAELRLKVYHRDAPLPLSDMLPVLENMGFQVLDEVPHRIAPAAHDAAVWLHDIGLAAAPRDAVDVAAVKADFEESFQRVWAGDAENDGFNRMIVAGLGWRQVVVLRACCKYLLQTNIPFGQAHMALALASYPAIARAIVELFERRFDPEAGDPSAADGIRQRIERALEAVQSLDDDRILRRFLNVVDSTLRTNYYQRGADGGFKPYLALKLDSKKVDELPLPRPLVEIFVYAPHVEAIHLRGGKVARGGIRWSDRRADFRTEVLGLMKAQMTKNAVIVPVGAKGGFYVKRLPPSGDREAMQKEGIACYRTFMRGLLDLTDNLVRGEVVPPADVVRLDGDDPYLVVAADKGTATFSDIANAIAREYGFWLDDAFASGGSAGYDHKKMGITARGAWESVKRHFREMGIDTQATDFTVAGVGDMSGDVFGNGMLLSGHIKLVAAFNHLHIFIDPSPDPALGLAERQRLFRLPRSSWADYDARLISRGGGVFERAAKSVKVSGEMRALLDLGPDDAIAPNDLIRAILKARVDLLWFGGIGAFVKAAEETHADVGDRANDGVRVDGAQLRAKVVAEGANLGVTQRGRVEYALQGGRINTDFIDNSAGVSTSDHEVNIKILLGEAIAAGELSIEERNRLLAEMTEDLASHVLMDNYRQSMALTHCEAQGAALLDPAIRFMRALERAGRLNRQVEFLPDDDALAERRATTKQGLTRPEFAVLLAYSKLTLFEDILASEVPDDPFLVQDRGLCFPKAVRDRFGEFIPRHRLQREITATYLSNSLVNRAGPTFVHEVASLAGAPPAEVAKAYLATRQIFSLRSYWAEIEALDYRIPADVQTGMALDILQLVRRGTLWMLRSGPKPLDVNRTVARYGPGVQRLADNLAASVPEPLRQSLRRDAEALVAKGVPERLAQRVAGLDVLFSAYDIVRTASETGSEVDAIARVYFDLGARFGFDWLRAAAERLTPETPWQASAITAIVEDLYAEQTELTVKIVEAAGGSASADAVLDAWQSANGRGIGRVESIVEELRRVGTVDIAMLSVANREIRSLLAH